jgi:hypothetical protein
MTKTRRQMGLHAVGKLATARSDLVSNTSNSSLDDAIEAILHMGLADDKLPFLEGIGREN